MSTPPNTLQPMNAEFMESSDLMSETQYIPNEVDVSWIRKGKVIIGTVQTEGNTFTTRATTAEEFVDNVNKALCALYNMPIDFAALPFMQKFTPSIEEFQKLSNRYISSSSIPIIVARQ